LARKIKKRGSPTPPTAHQSVVALLCQPANQQTLGLQQIFAGQSFRNKWSDPGGDRARQTEIVLKVNTRAIFTRGSKIAEHGGLNEHDIHAALLFLSRRCSHKS
jgi:hypothetical protein